MNPVVIKRALISVSDKTGLVDFARSLAKWNVDILSTGGTLSILNEAGIRARSISEFTGFPEILDGRVKTLHPKVHGALLAVSANEIHARQLRELDIQPIDMVVVNLYPFESTIRGGASLDEAIEQIDIGGPTLLRAAAKNFREKTAVADPARYNDVIAELERNNGAISGEFRFALAGGVFIATAHYDAAVGSYLTNLAGTSPGDDLPEAYAVSLQKAGTLRYGENPHQKAALYGDFHRYFEQIHGKELSYNNIVDIQAAADLVGEFDEPAAAIIKHTNPCGVGTGGSLAEAYAKALATDLKSAFGGIVAVNRPLTLEAAEMIDKIFTEVVVAPAFETEAADLLRKKKDRRLIRQSDPRGTPRQFDIKNVTGGLLVQSPDDIDFLPEKLKVTTKRHPTDTERSAMMFGWKVAKHVKSNAIVYALADRTVGIGAGQMSRVDSSRLAVQKAREAGLELKGTAVASDAFFPFADGLLEAVKAGATAVIQPGGSIRDGEVIGAADDHDIAMIFTGIRHFRH